jgi:hypothetical protein
VNNENSFDESQLTLFIEGIDSCFPKLFEAFPGGNLNITKKKAELMLKKTQNDEVQKSLERLLSLISSLNTKE